MKRLLVNIVLFFVAVFLLSTVGVFGLLYGLVYSILHYTTTGFLKYWTEVIYSLNIGIDQLGNVMLSPFLNKFCLVTKNLYIFGKADETISYVLAINYFTNNLTSFGLKIVLILEKIDKGHMKKSLNRNL